MNKNGYLAVGGIAGLYIVIVALFLTTSSSDYYDFFIRLFALTGLYSLCIATLMTPFLSEVYKAFGKPFLTIHHVFAAVGISSATLHPVLFAIDVGDPTIFIPDTSSWLAFWELAGRPALILIYVAVLSVLIRNRIKKYWRIVHSLIYVVIFMVLVHGILIGSDFENIGIIAIYSSLFVAVIVGFIYKRINMRSRK